MTWWQAILSTLGIFGFWPAYAVIGDRVDIWFQNRQTWILQGKPKVEVLDK